MHVEIESETDGRWIAEGPSMPGALGHGSTKAAAVAKLEALELRILADKVAPGEDVPQICEALQPR